LTGVGDLTRLLRLPSEAPLSGPQEVATREVLGPSGEAWSADAGAPVLLLGDSFVNVFSQAELGWGTGAGLAEQLAFVLQRPVDRIALNAGGALTARRALVTALEQDPHRLRSVELVVYAFSERELSLGDWKPLPLPPVGAP
jgi:alginate O-acetyltransferase complex protein AlgJ